MLNTTVIENTCIWILLITKLSGSYSIAIGLNRFLDKSKRESSHVYIILFILFLIIYIAAIGIYYSIQ